MKRLKKAFSISHHFFLRLIGKGLVKLKDCKTVGIKKKTINIEDSKKTFASKFARILT